MLLPEFMSVPLKVVVLLPLVLYEAVPVQRKSPPIVTLALGLTAVVSKLAGVIDG